VRRAGKGTTFLVLDDDQLGRRKWIKNIIIIIIII